ncbi:uncharacterized protein LOC115669450 [Syzygium oleosum]|uniref:uncharacterized protein LOC115669450 n=1 Tax=Syzygium oleosum TaxID=219896 RepID=UPI0011D23FC9|nr:uncharacterized protein LOC115669450 [Syzygium oleosum]XP_030446523.1 uncharacterized protein LOC115669450 [Syzygium oleosum]XP_030446529.1 uncharacterized protein LOC115669450 [Syzygium oleosum]XP_030446534.1 uncharacterized protein LOC115669450 [Syzygium oleosum]
MLSIENPPPDPPCPCQVPLLNNPSFDERASTSHTLAFSEVDLQSKNPPPPNFSIREYVFKARSKNIQTNWPFSLKNLQLCLKHGVKDLLPPFQHPDTVRTQLSKRCKVEARSLNKRSISNWERREQPSPRPNSDLPSFDSDVNSNSNHDTVPSCKDISSLKSGGEDDYPLITTSAVSGSQIEPVSTSRQPSSVVETDALVESSVRKDKEATSGKAVSTSQPSGKKCRLIVKFGGKSERSSTEDISSNCTSISEAMASKVCPVCKTFSSSSNTTLNAHIDQCLSIESTPKQAADKLIRPRIKPRKIKLMVDIYTKAPKCTIEELDRRNGSNWAGVSCLPRDAEPSAEGKKKTSSVVNGDGANDAGAVYIDANGTKLRILSKFNDVPLVSQVREDLGLKRSLRGSKGRKAFSKKRRLHGSKHHKYLKVSSKGKKIHHRKAHELQVIGNHKKHNKLQEGSVGSQRQTSRSQGLMKPGDSGSLRTWASSKRTGLAKKAATRDFPPLRCQLHLAQNILVESGQSSPGNNLTMDSGLQKSSCLSDQQMSEEKEMPLDGSQMIDKMEQSPGRKRLGSMLGGRTGDITEGSPSPAKRKFRKDNSLGDSSTLMNLQDNSEHCSLPLVRNKTLEIHASPDSDYGISRNMNARLSRNSRAFSRKALRFSTLRKRVLSLCQSPEINSKSNRTEKCSNFEKSSMLLATEMGEKVVALQPKLQHRYEVGQDPAEHQSAGEESFDDMSFSERVIGQERGGRSPLPREKANAFRSTPSASHCFDDIEGENIQPSFAVCAGLPERIDGVKSNPNEVNDDVNSADMPSGLAMEDASWGLSRYFSSEYDNHMNSRFKTHSQRLLGTSKVSLFTDGGEFSTAEDDGNGANEQNGNDRADEDSEDGQASSFPEIDPIPIPGPPGSFLPSPGAMGSEDFQGNSSLTTSQVHSSQDQQDLVDGDSSDSPVSATSTISNSVENRVDVDCSERVAPHEHQNNSWSGFLGTCNEPSVKDVPATAQASTEVVESNAENAEKLRVGNRSIKKGPPFSTTDDQPCCCQRKERLSQNIALSYRESPHVSRRMMAPLAVPGMGKQLGRIPYAGPAQMDGRPETFNPTGCMSAMSERSASPTVYSSRDPVTYPDDRLNGPGRGDSDLASPSASNPILRLMGKDLVVVSKEEDASVPLGQFESPTSAQKNNPSPQFPLYSGVLSAGGQSQKYGLMDHLVIQGSKITREDLNGTGEPHFGAGAPGSSISFLNSKTAKVPPSAFVTQQRLVNGFTDARDYNGGYSSSTQLCQPVDVPNAFTMHNQVRIVSFPETQPKRAGSPANLPKEIIVIDDAPENNEADLSKNPEIFRDHMPLSRTIDCDPRQASPFFPHQSQDPLYYGGYPADFSARSNAHPVASSHNAEGSMLQQAPFTAASSSRGHLRPSILYYPPSLS